MTFTRSGRRGPAAYPLRWALAALVLALGACSALIDKPAAPVDSVRLPAATVWEYPASEFPAMCISLLPEGKLEFKGGFLFFNPGSWRIEPGTGHLALTLGGSAAFPAVSARDEVKTPASRLVKFDAPARRLEYRIDSKTESLGFGGFVFYKKASCSAIQ